MTIIALIISILHLSLGVKYEALKQENNELNKAIEINKDLGIESLISDNDKDAYSLNKDDPDAYLNNTVTFKYAMINDQVSKQTYQDLECLFANLIKKLTNK